MTKKFDALKNAHKISSYQSEWRIKFSIEKERLQEIFGDTALGIEHIGSTSIEGLSAKPIIDIAVMIEAPENADTFTEPLNKIGYRFDSLCTERHYYLKGNPIEYHLSIAYADKGGFWPRQILFRDYLRLHPEARDEYAKLKEDLAQKYPSGSDGYIEGKTEFVNKILALAGFKQGQTYKSMNVLNEIPGKADGIY